MAFFAHIGKPLNLGNPRSFNEKLQWLKLYDRNPEYKVLVDKVRVKEWVKSRIGAEHVIPTITVWDDPDQIDFGMLPPSFALKTNHDSGSAFVCRDKEALDRDSAIKQMRASMQRDYFFGLA